MEILKENLTDWKSIQELEDLTNFSNYKVKKLLKELIKENIVEKDIYVCGSGRGGFVGSPTWFNVYKLK